MVLMNQKTFCWLNSHLCWMTCWGKEWSWWVNLLHAPPVTLCASVTNLIPPAPTWTLHFCYSTSRTGAAKRLDRAVGISLTDFDLPQQLYCVTLTTNVYQAAYFLVAGTQVFHTEWLHVLPSSVVHSRFTFEYIGNEYRWWNNQAWIEKSLHGLSPSLLSKIWWRLQAKFKLNAYSFCVWF